MELNLDLRFSNAGIGLHHVDVPDVKRVIHIDDCHTFC